jgi:hypothetical protein
MPVAPQNISLINILDLAKFRLAPRVLPLQIPIAACTDCTYLDYRTEFTLSDFSMLNRLDLCTRSDSQVDQSHSANSDCSIGCMLGCNHFVTVPLRPWRRFWEKGKVFWHCSTKLKHNRLQEGRKLYTRESRTLLPLCHSWEHPSPPSPVTPSPSRRRLYSILSSPARHSPITNSLGLSLRACTQLETPYNIREVG